MLPDMLHFWFVAALIITMMAINAFLIYGYRVQQMSSMGQAMNFWTEFTLINPDARCILMMFSCNLIHR